MEGGERFERDLFFAEHDMFSDRARRGKAAKRADGKVSFLQEAEKFSADGASCADDCDCFHFRIVYPVNG